MADGTVAARPAGPRADRIVFLGHATVLIELDGVRLLTDPVLGSHVGHLLRRHVAPVQPSLHAAPDAVLISHMHYDHLDLSSLRLLPARTPLLVPVGAGEWLRGRGFGEVRELSVGECARVGALAIVAVPALHAGARHPHGPRAETLGYLVRERRSVYFAGDTALFAGMADLAPALDVALLPVAGWGPTLGPGHMGPLDAARAARLLAPRVAIPIHWGTLRPLARVFRARACPGAPARLFAEHVARLAADVEVRILAPGQATTLDP